MIDTNLIVHAYLTNSTDCPNIYAAVADRIYCPRLPEKVDKPALVFFTRGGDANPHIPGLPSPSIQFDCWAKDPDDATDVGAGPRLARAVYTALYNDFQGIQNKSVVVSGTTYYIKTVVEEVHGQDIQDQEYPKYYKVIAFFKVMIQAE